jgi:predicted amidohydrolase YtcJ
MSQIFASFNFINRDGDGIIPHGLWKSGQPLYAITSFCTCFSNPSCVQVAFEKDPVVRGRSVVLQSKDGHALWVSSSVIQSMLPLPETVDGGVIVRDPSKEPIGKYISFQPFVGLTAIIIKGVFIDNAQDLVKKPALTDIDLERRFSITVKNAISSGLTSIHDAGFDPISLEFFKRHLMCLSS